MWEEHSTKSCGHAAKAKPAVQVKEGRRADGAGVVQRPEESRPVGAMDRGRDYRCVRVKRWSQASSISTLAPIGQKLGPDRLLLSTRAFRVPD